MDLQELYATRDRMRSTGSFGPGYVVTLDLIREAELRLGMRSTPVISLDKVANESSPDVPKKD